MLLLVTFFITVTETLTKVNVKRSKINSKAKLFFFPSYSSCLLGQNCLIFNPQKSLHWLLHVFPQRSDPLISDSDTSKPCGARSAQSHFSYTSFKGIVRKLLAGRV